MNKNARRIYLKAAAIGSVSGALVFSALTWVQALGGTPFAVTDTLSRCSELYGRQVTITGVANTVRRSWKKKSFGTGKARTSQQVEYTSFNLHEPGKGKRRLGSRYISVSVPSSALGNNQPEKDRGYTVTGVLQPPYNLGKIGD